jgi:hypothetical protein
MAGVPVRHRRPALSTRHLTSSALRNLTIQGSRDRSPLRSVLGCPPTPRSASEERAGGRRPALDTGGLLVHRVLVGVGGDEHTSIPPVHEPAPRRPPRRSGRVLEQVRGLVVDLERVVFIQKVAGEQLGDPQPV